jgi:hypothetical protein
MKYVYLVLNWVFGISFVFMAIMMAMSVPLAGLSLAVIALLLLPPVRTFTYSKINKELPFKFRAISIFALIIISGVLFGNISDKEAQAYAEQKALKQAEKVAQIKQENLDYFTANRERIILEAKASLESEDYQLVITENEKYLVSNDSEIENIVSSAQEKLSNIRALAEAELEKAKKIEKTEQLLAQLKKIPASEYEINRDLYQQLVALHPENVSYKNKVTLYSDKLENEIQKRLAAETRIAQIKRQFSGWDGSHSNLERFIISGMNDPDSYEHDKTVYLDEGDHLIVQTSFRGKNGFGGVVRNSVTAKVSLNGKILEILDQN